MLSMIHYWSSDINTLYLKYFHTPKNKTSFSHSKSDIEADTGKRIFKTPSNKDLCLVREFVENQTCQTF